jgi:pimeloyl-ACP methyl ester carboxylesterase
MLERRRLRARGLVFDVLTVGDPAGEPVLLLHGFPQTAACWTRLTGALAGAGYRVLAPDQRGYSPGARPGAVRDYRMAELVADVLALADRARVVGPIHLVGHDWGGMVAWHLAARHPERVATLTAVSTPHPRASRPPCAPAPSRCARPTSPSSAPPACPSWSWGREGCPGCGSCSPAAGSAPNGSRPTPAPWPTGEPWPRRWPGTGRPARPPFGSRRWPSPPATCGGRVTRPWAGGPRWSPPAGCRPLQAPCPGRDRPLAARAARRRAGRPAAGPPAALAGQLSQRSGMGAVTLDAVVIARRRRCDSAGIP